MPPSPWISGRGEHRVDESQARQPRSRLQNRARRDDRIRADARVVAHRCTGLLDRRVDRSAAPDEADGLVVQLAAVVRVQPTLSSRKSFRRKIRWWPGGYSSSTPKTV